jgi:hypothetical protein
MGKRRFVPICGSHGVWRPELVAACRQKQTQGARVEQGLPFSKIDPTPADATSKAKRDVAELKISRRFATIAKWSLAKSQTVERSGNFADRPAHFSAGHPVHPA